MLRRLLLVSALASTACNASVHVEECERLHRLACDCFPLCQKDDQAAVESSDPAVCEKKLREDFDTWQVCASGLRQGGMRCDQSCTYGWGTCAFDIYRQAGLAPANACDKVQ
jgi:hypothetical protein